MYVTILSREALGCCGAGAGGTLGHHEDDAAGGDALPRRVHRRRAGLPAQPDQPRQRAPPAARRLPRAPGGVQVRWLTRNADSDLPAHACACSWLSEMLQSIPLWVHQPEGQPWPSMPLCPLSLLLCTPPRGLGCGLAHSRAADVMMLDRARGRPVKPVEADPWLTESALVRHPTHGLCSLGSARARLRPSPWRRLLT